MFQIFTVRLLSLSAVLMLLAGCPGKREIEQDAAISGGDASAGPDGTYTSAGACPCGKGFECIVKTCRRKCTEQGCNIQGQCSGDESCLIQGVNKLPVCMPGVGRGRPCDTATPCKAGHLCLSTSTSGATGRCYPTCTSAGVACPTGGKCYNTPGGKCKYCYP